MFLKFGFVALVLLSAGLLGRLLYSLLKQRKGPLPPGPEPVPILGNLLQLPKSLPWLHMYHLSKQYGPIMHLNMAGQPMVVLSTPQAAHDLLNKRGGQYSDRPRMVMAFEMATRGLHMLFRQYDERFRLHQRLHAPVLGPQASNTYRILQDMESRQTLLDMMHDQEKLGQQGISFHHHIERAVSSTIYCLVFGYRLKTGYEQELLDEKHVEAEFARIGQVGTHIVDLFPWLNYLPRCLAPWKQEADDLYELEESVHMRNRGKALRSKNWSIAKQMMTTHAAQGMPTDEFAFNIGILANAGIDTSTIALSWFIVAWVTSGSRWVPKVQQILDEVVGKDRLPTFEDRPKLAYIDAIVNEVLRWRPVAIGGVPHFTKTEDTYMGYHIPANSIVLPNYFAIGRDESVYGADADTFVPERWLTDMPVDQEPRIDASGLNVSALKDLHLAAFGHGRRICPGRHVARNSLFIQMARLLWAFDVKPGIDETTGKRIRVNDMDCQEGFMCLPKLFNAVVRPRGQWARDVILNLGDTHDWDYSEVLGQGFK